MSRLQQPRFHLMSSIAKLQSVQSAVAFKKQKVFNSTISIVVQSGLSSRAKHGGTVFSVVSGSIKDLATVPGSYNHLGP